MNRECDKCSCEKKMEFRESDGGRDIYSNDGPCPIVDDFCKFLMKYCDGGDICSKDSLERTLNLYKSGLYPKC